MLLVGTEQLNQARFDRRRGAAERVRQLGQVILSQPGRGQFSELTKLDDHRHVLPQQRVGCGFSAELVASGGHVFAGAGAGEPELRSGECLDIDPAHVGERADIGGGDRRLPTFERGDPPTAQSR